MPQTRFVEKLKAATAVTDLVVARIWPLVRESDDLPAIVYEVSNRGRSNTASGATSTGELRLAAHCYAATYAGAWALAGAVETAVGGSADSAGDVWHLDVSGDGEGVPSPGNDTMDVFEVFQEYTVWHAV